MNPHPIADPVRCPFPAHGEEWARNALARGRLRGETLHMWHCPLEDHWHVTFKSVAELLEPGEWRRTDAL